VSLDEEARHQLAALEAAARLRTRRERQAPAGAEVVVDGELRIDFGSNDYLGLAADPRLIAAAQAAAATYGVGAAGSQLVLGRTASHAALERELCAWLGAPAAVTFGSGYAANTGVLATFGDADTIVFSDALNHASLIDGCRLSRAEVVIYRHGDVEELERRLAAAPAGRRRLVVTETLFSMDGDVAELAALDVVRRRHGAALVLDEAHALGVLGPAGRGLAAAVGVEADVVVGTFGKALGCAGAFAVGSQAVIDLLWNRARPLVFSTALPALVLEAARVAVAITAGPDGEARRARLHASAAALRRGLPGRAGGASGSPIVPIFVGDDHTVMALAAALAAHGLLVPAIRPPTVPPGTARLRVSLSSGHTPAQLTSLIAALR